MKRKTDSTFGTVRDLRLKRNSGISGKGNILDRLCGSIYGMDYAGKSGNESTRLACDPGVALCQIIAFIG